MIDAFISNRRQLLHQTSRITLAALVAAVSLIGIASAWQAVKTTDTGNALLHSRKSSIPTSRQMHSERLVSLSRAPGLIPNDPNFADQWPLHNTGQSGGVADADIDAPEAWTVTTGSMKTVVAVLDAGVDFTHRELYLNIWLNPREIPASIAAKLADADRDGLITFRDLNADANKSLVVDHNANGYIDGGDLLADPNWENGLDEDSNGKTDDLVGWDCRDNDNDPRPNRDNHGTNMALVIGAHGDDGIGRAGLNWFIQMMPVRIRGDGLTSIVNADAAAGLDYAVERGVSISNNSWRAGPDHVFSPEIHDAIGRARKAGHLFVGAAGNGSRDSDAKPWYPGANDWDNMLITAALTNDNKLSKISNWGAKNVDLGVPAYGGATSNSTAITTGVAALLKSAHPDWSHSQIKDRLLSTVDPLPSLKEKTITGGRLNAATALGYQAPAAEF